MLKMSKKLFIYSLVAISVLSLLSSPVGASEPAIEKGSSFFNPSIADMKKYPQFYDTPVSSPIIPESEMTHIQFSQEWLLNNDTNIDPNTVSITFPKAWMETSPSIYSDDKLIELSVPTAMLNSDNQSSDPEEISISYSNVLFEGLPVTPRPSVPLEDSGAAISDLAGGFSTDSVDGQIDYQRRINYQPYVGDNITGLFGTITPYLASNTGNETFVTYHEIETYGYGYDCVEVICAYSYPGDISIWYAIYDNGYWSTGLNFLRLSNISVSSSCYYQFSIDTLGNITCWIYSSGQGWGTATYYDSTPTSSYYSFQGSSEMDFHDWQNNYFAMVTSPMTIENLQTTSTTWHDAYYVYQRLAYISTEPYQQFVYPTATLTTGGLFYNLYTASTI